MRSSDKSNPNFSCLDRCTFLDTVIGHPGLKSWRVTEEGQLQTLFPLPTQLMTQSHMADQSPPTARETCVHKACDAVYRG